ncbi:MAG TPA: CPBP family intramembrane glutamic endopeptidase [Candidatus Limnocylindria bacterium]|nr:CPBP family intramembrane glutamic endopeptidase [Candidatus Limnocylindria bacterium]
MINALPRRIRVDALADPAIAVSVGYLLALLIAEIALIGGGLLAGAICQALLLLTLLAHRILVPGASYRALLSGFALLSVVRLLSMTVPVAGLPVLAWQVMVGVPAFLAIVLALRAERVDPELIGFVVPPDAAVVVLSTAAGIPIGLLGWLALRPPPMVTALSPLSVAVAIVVTLVFIVALQELLFRGVIQGLALDAIGSSTVAVGISTAAYTIMLLGSLSAPFVILSCAFALGLGLTVERTGSIWAAVGAQASATLGMVLVWPLLLGSG